MSDIPSRLNIPRDHVAYAYLLRILEMTPYVQAALDKLVKEGKGSSDEARRLKDSVDSSNSFPGSTWVDTNGIKWDDEVFIDHTTSTAVCNKGCGDVATKMDVYYYDNGTPRRIHVVVDGIEIVRVLFNAYPQSGIHSVTGNIDDIPELRAYFHRK
jgi:hypothetical protein